METSQEIFWGKEFGKEYSDRNSWLSDEEWDRFYLENWGSTKLQINDTVLKDVPKDARILEVGCNIGMQLRGFQRMGFMNLYGIELQDYAVEKAKKLTQHINIIQGSGFDLPFRDGYFDLVCTNGVLIHIAPADHRKFMEEIFRTSKKYIMGWEYFSTQITDISYRGNIGVLWKADFAKIYQDNFPALQPRIQKQYPYLPEKDKGNVDEIFLLSK